MALLSSVRSGVGAFWRALDTGRRFTLNLLFLLILLALLYAIFGGGAKPLQPKTMLVLDLKGQLVEQTSPAPHRPLARRRPPRTRRGRARRRACPAIRSRRDARTRHCASPSTPAPHVAAQGPEPPAPAAEPAGQGRPAATTSAVLDKVRIVRGKFKPDYRDRPGFEKALRISTRLCIFNVEPSDCAAGLGPSSVQVGFFARFP